MNYRYDPAPPGSVNGPPIPGVTPQSGGYTPPLQDRSYSGMGHNSPTARVPIMELLGQQHQNQGWQTNSPFQSGPRAPSTPHPNHNPALGGYGQQPQVGAKNMGDQSMGARPQGGGGGMGGMPMVPGMGQGRSPFGGPQAGGYGGMSLQEAMWRGNPYDIALAREREKEEEERRRLEAMGYQARHTASPVGGSSGGRDNAMMQYMMQMIMGGGGGMPGGGGGGYV